MTLQAGVLGFISYFFAPETYATILLRKKANKLRKETGNQDLYSVLDTVGVTAKQRFRGAIIRPMKLLLTHPPVFILSLYVAVVYGVLYLMFSTFTFVFAKQYGFGTGTVGLAYLPTGIGMLFGTMVFGVLTDVVVKKKIAQNGKTVPEDRLPIWMTVPTGLLIVASLFWYGWSTQEHTHWIVPMIGVSLFCFGLMGIMVSHSLQLSLSVSLLTMIDVSANIPCRRLHLIRSLSSRSTDCLSMSRWRSASSCWFVHV